MPIVPEMDQQTENDEGGKSMIGIIVYSLVFTAVFWITDTKEEGE
jgi:hypothetical protein